ncbi:Aliphatic amidase expression-regulating protein [Methylobacterium tardum]|jgi:urea transport system substrate-binding protein|uniref:Amino acid ABC substrate-binding protein n=1 Tax=Methylobacterium tardum TaxID=374432 RepID=A0AA37WRN8_9HYPH|nr:transporter substrate-binding domain-containing protein [Methylobacterium tardum]URD35494.1 transporter substrate-binding domain-containing protein [Methylobacterium tardum]GJE50545.1 Aliphatic amidase expression-regulating protein [Methylobacterium tardum]GLS69177.1 amino acid ABC substrate-binding protein [Methylobacterium tardum]
MPGRDEATWRVGVLFSRSGVSGITETEHFLGTALAIEEINTAGGVLGRPIAPICYDPAGDTDAYRAYARRMLAEDGAEVVFGCSLSASRKSVLSTVERHNGLLWYPSIYEGFEYSENIVYTGATLNQNVFALADYLLQEHGPRIFLIGSDYIYPRESNRVMRDLIEAKGGTIVGELYAPLDADDAAHAAMITEIRHAAPDAVFSTVVGRGAERLYRAYAGSGIDRTRCPIASLTLAEGQIRAIGPELCSGHVLAASYFSALAGDANRRFVEAFQARFGAERPTSMWSETAYAQVHLFAQALTEAGTLDAERLGAAALRQRIAAPEGELAFDGETRHIWLTPGIGVARSDGQFDVVWRARRPVRPDPYLAWSRFETNWLDEGMAA